MKFVALAIGLIGILPLALFLQSNVRVRNKVWILLGLLPFISLIIPHSDMAIVTWDQIWFSYVPGLQVSAIDLIAIAMYFSIRHKTNKIHYHLPFVLYLAAISLSMISAEEPMAALFYVWQFIRIYFFTVVVAKACTDPDVPPQLMKGMALGLAVQFFVVLWQKIGLGIIEPTGTFAHRNTLGLIIHLVVFPHFSLFLAGQRQLQYTATSVFGLAIASIIASRAALGFSVFGFAATFLLSLVRRLTGWKAIVGIGSVLVAVAIAPIAASSLQKRFDIDPLVDGYDERAAFNRTALSMLEDNPFGVGVNHYSYIGKTRGYSVRAGVAPVEGSLNNTVHNAYLLAGAEAGYFGFIAFIMLLFCPLAVALRYSWLSDRRDPRGDLLLGLAVGMIAVYVHSMFEYIIVIKEVQYVLAIAFGMTFGLAHQIKTERSNKSANLVRPRLIQTGSLLRQRPR
jgi:hypothetical protein